jgi:thiol-disulfide isomerase/thioredoxin
LLFKHIKQSDKNLINLRALGLIFENAFEIPEIDKMEVYNSFPEELRKSPDGIEAINNRDLFKKNIGSSIQEFSNITVTNQENQRIKFLDLFKRKYEFYLLIFGASWCKPCRYENRFLKNSIRLIDTTKVKIYNFSGDYNREKWIKSVMEDNCPWESFLLENGFQSSLIKSLNFISVPRNFLINANLIIIKEHTDIKIIMKMIS